MMKQNAPPTFEQLVDWLEGQLTPEQARLIAEQMTVADAAAQADLAWLQKFYQTTQNLNAADLPTTIIQRLEHHFAAYAASRRQPSFFQRLVAALSFDSRLTLATGMRAAAPSHSQRQLVYATDLATIALTLQPRSQDKNMDMLGQFLPTQEITAELVQVVLRQEQTEFDSTFTDDLGEFVLTALPIGLYTLVLTGNQYEIQITPLDLSL